ncbi:spermidine/putrescine ABC transporter permease [Martelella endophytica]|uniref:Spermidine/putrescine ABC transporter permease n=1 Tax=Martelella endophytica TaxID=1486262 RepID=A0A0D5LWK8_MAREN|nr:spermidine/putrescine ABC transporter permease [Martelella endophytica]
MLAWFWLVVVAGYFILPLIAMGMFSFWAGGSNYNFSAYVALFQDGDMWRSLTLSLRLAVETIVITQVLLIPTVLFVSLRAPKLRLVLEMISNMPFVVPAIVLVAGLSALYRGPSWFVSSPEFMIPGYVILALPYTYRALDVGVQALDVKTLTQAGLSLGASWTQIFLRVIIPNLRSAIIGSTLLMLAIVLGEFTFANVLLFNTFAVYINYIGQTSGTEAAALSLFSFLFTWLAMLGIMITGAKRGGR